VPSLLPPPAVHPELPWCLEARLSRAWLKRLTEDEVLGPLFGVGSREGSMVLTEGPDMLELQSTEFPALAVYVGASKLNAKGSSHLGFKKIELFTQLLTKPQEEWGKTEDQLRLRICARIELLATRDMGVLSDEDGDLNLAITELARVGLEGRRLPSGGRLTVIGMMIETDVNTVTMEVLE
jgi:hypothetical protein